MFAWTFAVKNGEWIVVYEVEINSHAAALVEANTTQVRMASAFVLILFPCTFQNNASYWILRNLERKLSHLRFGVLYCCA
jgi:hypothetical protein